MNDKKILLTGSSGLLGSTISKYFTSVYACDKEFDITNVDMVNKKLNAQKPDIIIHAAAFTNVEACELEVDKAYKINALGTQNLVNYCIGKNILFIYISSTGIYGTKKSTRYNEFDTVMPTTIHHKTKYEGENIVKTHLNKFLILRTGWLYGGEISHGKNFVYKRYLEAKDASKIYSDNTQIGNPTYVNDFVNQIELLINSNQYGIFNCVNDAKDVTRYEYVQKIIKYFDLECDVLVAPDGMFKRIAPVSYNESAINYKLTLLDINLMGDWEISLGKYIDSIKSEL
jgi:dTDP-4-dehydrorhamnose reductase